jgi:tetratricopeptide (TPR) repeat protein
LVAVVASYLPVLGAPFVWDDHHLIEQNPVVQRLHPLGDYFGQGFWQGDDLEQGRVYYRPLTILSLALDERVFGNQPGGFHLTNLCVHLLSAGLLFALLRARGTSGYAAVLGTALWALHPRLTEAVAWIAGRTDVLATFFVLCALLAQARSSWRGRVLCAAFLLCGLLCKEVALAGVAAVLVSELVSQGSLRERLQRMTPTVLAVILYLIGRMHAAGIVTVKPAAPSGHFLRFTAALGRYFTMLLTPWFPNAQIGSLGRPGMAYCALGCAVLVGIVWWLITHGRRRDPALMGPLALTAVGFGLVLHVVPFSINVVAADRFLYLPLVGLTLLLTPRLAALGKARLVASAATVLAVSFGAVSFARASVWSDEVALWTTTYRDNPDNPSSTCSELGRLYARAGLFPQAFSIDLECDRSELSGLILANNAASLLARSGRYQQAAGLLGALGAPARPAPVFSFNMALFRTYLNDFAAARSDLAHALEIDPKYADGLALAKRLPEMERQRRYVDSLSESAAPVERARLFAKLGMAVEALHAWRAALADDPAQRELDEGMGFSLAEADAATIEDFYHLYQARVGEHGTPNLVVAYEEHRELVERLLAAWPTLHLKLLELPS